MCQSIVKLLKIHYIKIQISIFFKVHHVICLNMVVRLKTKILFTSKIISVFGGAHHSPRPVSPHIWFPWRQDSIARYQTACVSSGVVHHVQGANQLPVGGHDPPTDPSWRVELNDPHCCTALSSHTTHTEMCARQSEHAEVCHNLDRSFVTLGFEIE